MHYFPPNCKSLGAPAGFPGVRSCSISSGRSAHSGMNLTRPVPLRAFAQWLIAHKLSHLPRMIGNPCVNASLGHYPILRCARDSSSLYYRTSGL
jgi:hypothetical protein